MNIAKDRNVLSKLKGDIMKIFLGILALICFIGMIGEEKKEDKENLTIGFVVTIAGLIIFKILGV